MAAGELGQHDLLHASVDERLNAVIHVVHRAHEDGSARLLLRAAAERHGALDHALLERRVLV